MGNAAQRHGAAAQAPRRVGWLFLGAMLLLSPLTVIRAEPPMMPPPSSETVKAELVNVVESQLAAFRAGDFARAYTYAATGIKELFPAKDFERMVKTTYPLIAKSRSADFGLAFDTGEEAVINVRVTGEADGKNGSYQYTLQKEEGAWKITGVSELPDDSLSV